VAHTASATTLSSNPLAGVRTRRIVALALDLVLVSILAAVIWIALLILTLGLSLLLLPPLFPLIAFFYNGLTVSGRKMATPGMRALGLEMRMHEDAAHALFFYVSWFFPPIFLVSLVDADKRCLHDMLAGVTVVRRM
jgi:uncharacterized RDD family membrane protein YckC